MAPVSGIRPSNTRKFGWAPETPSIKDWPFKDSPYASNPMPTEDSKDRRELGLNAPVTDQGDTRLMRRAINGVRG